MKSLVAVVVLTFSAPALAQGGCDLDVPLCTQECSLAVARSHELLEAWRTIGATAMGRERQPENDVADFAAYVQTLSEPERFYMEGRLMALREDMTVACGVEE